MIRVILLLIILLLGYWLAGKLAKTPRQDIARYLKKTGWMLAIAILALLGLTGKLNWLFALLGVLLASIGRLLPLLVNIAPQLHRFWRSFQHSTSADEPFARRSPPHQRHTAMSREEALAVLGLQATAREAEIIDAHRKLMQRVHPDRGGSDYLAAQINLAKKVLLGR